jgi:RNA polymerase sigma factor (sigma-70 family)
MELGPDRVSTGTQKLRLEICDAINAVAAVARAAHWSFYTDGVTAERETQAPGGAMEILLENHRAFLRYLEGRVGDRALAEDILQDAFTRNLGRVQGVAEEALIPWFYRTLRNAAIDQYRRRGTAARALDAFAREIETQEQPSDELAAEICACVTRLAATLKPEYAEALKAIDVEGVPVKAFAEQKGLSASNAGVRVFRARDALRKRVVESCGTCAEHGCYNCSCATR